MELLEFDDSDLNPNVDIIKPIISRNGLECENCGNNMRDAETYYVCENCGQIAEHIQKEVNINDCKAHYNSNKSGKGVSNGKHNSNNNTDHKSLALSKIKDNIKMLNANSKNVRIPESVISFAIQKIYNSIRNYRVSRCDRKNGIIANCLLVACRHLHIPRTPDEIAEIMQIEKTVITSNQTIVLKYIQEHNLFIANENLPEFEFMNRFANALNLKPIYINFAIELLNAEQVRCLTIIHNSKLNTRCAGVINFLLEIYGNKTIQEEIIDIDPVTAKKIEEITKVAQTTFKKTTQIFYKYYRLFKSTFKRNRMPMPKEWQRKIKDHC